MYNYICPYTCHLSGAGSAVIAHPPLTRVYDINIIAATDESGSVGACSSCTMNSAAGTATCTASPPHLNTTGYSSTYLAMGFANVRAGTRYPPEH